MTSSNFCTTDHTLSARWEIRGHPDRGNLNSTKKPVSVALSGKTVLAGADDDFNTVRSGRAYIFSLGQ